MDLLERRQYEEAATAPAARAEVEAHAADLHTSIPGIVQAFDQATQTATVRPAIKRYFRGQGFKDLPDLMDVPVQFPRGGGYVLTFPVVKGDECMLLFSERAIDTWFESGGVQAPHDYRLHDLSDACAVVGISSKPKRVQGFSGDAVELRRLDGAAKVRIDNSHNIDVTSDVGNISVASAVGLIKLNAPPGATPLVNGVLNASHPCPILGVQHGLLGPPCLRVLAGST